MLNLKLYLLSLLILLPIGTAATWKIDKLVIDENDIESEDMQQNEVENCKKGKYYDAELNRCFECTPCSDFMFELNTCTDTQNTLCGWCGNAGPVESMTNSVLMSYQAKCLMTRLKFVNMKNLDQLDREYADSEEINDDSEDEYESDDQKEEYTGELISMKVNQYVKHRKAMNAQIIDVRVDENDVDGLFEIPVKKTYIREEVEKMIPWPPGARDEIWSEDNDNDNENEEDDASVEEPIEVDSNEMLKWDEWLDDRVRPLVIEKIKLITSIKDKQIEAKAIADNSRSEVIVVDAEEPLPEEYEMEASYINRNVDFWPRFICLMVLFFAIFLVLLRMTIKSRKTFRVLELHPDDYKILQTCGHNAEKKNYENCVHENPLYLP